MEAGLDWELEEAVDPKFGLAFAIALGSEGFEGVRDLLEPEVTWHIAGEGVFSGTYEGVEAVLELLRTIQGKGINFSVFDNLVSDAHLGLLLTLDREVRGGKVSAYAMWLMHVDGGRSGECFWYLEDAAAFEELVKG
jgi:hypothetical protein